MGTTSPALYVVFFQSRYGNFQHWALYLDSGTEHIVFEVSGEHPSFERNVVAVHPETDPTYLGKLFVGLINHNDIAAVKDIVRETIVDNENVEWDCQEYVLDILERLQDGFYLDPDDEEYRDAKTELKGKRGAIL